MRHSTSSLRFVNHDPVIDLAGKLIAAKAQIARDTSGKLQLIPRSTHVFGDVYQIVLRYFRKLRAPTPPQARAIIETRAGEECQVDYGTGPILRDPRTGKYRRTRLFMLTVGYGRISVRLLVFRSSS